MPKPKKRTIYIFLIALVTLYVVIEVIPLITGALTRTETLEFGDLKVSDQVDCYLVREETVYAASAGGHVEYKVSQGDLVKKGTGLFDFSKDGGDDSQGDSQYADMISRLGDRLVVREESTAPQRGIFSTYIDGYEGLFTPDTMEQLTFEQVSDWDIAGEDVTGETVSAGDPIYKIADSKEWYIIFWVDSGLASRYTEGNDLSVVLPEGEVQAQVSRIVAQGDRILVILETDRYYAGFAGKRDLKAEIVTVDRRGLLVSNSAITTKDGVVGVYVKNTIGEFTFKPVRTLATDGEKTLVTDGIYYDQDGLPVETVDVYDEVLLKPEAEQGT